MEGRVRTVSMLIALMAIVVVAIVLGVMFAGYAFSIFSAYHSDRLQIREARYYYFTEKPNIIYNKCVKPPCGIVVVYLYSSGLVRISLIKYWNYTWKPEMCLWQTTRRGYLDPGYNIIVLTNPSLATSYIPACRIVSPSGNPTAYKWFYDIVLSDGDATSLTPTELYILKEYADLTVNAIFSPTSLKIITANAGEYVVPVVPRRVS